SDAAATIGDGLPGRSGAAQRESRAAGVKAHAIVTRRVRIAVATLGPGIVALEIARGLLGEVVFEIREQRATLAAGSHHGAGGREGAIATQALAARAATEAVCIL